MQRTDPVHKQRKRKPRGVRMDEDLWRFVDRIAAASDDGNTSALIERWVREKRDAMREVVA